MPESASRVFLQVRHWVWALDPIHVGMGRQQISRIDMPVTREQGTQLPVIPGSSLTGVCRAYSAMKHAMGVPKLACAGRGDQDGEGHCGRPDCPVCYSFGFSREKSTQSRQGLVQITTAHLLFFPIASQYGPIWITCYRRLKEAGWEPPNGQPLEIHPGHFLIAKRDSLPEAVKALALGWLNLQRQQGEVNMADWKVPGVVRDSGLEPAISIQFQDRLGPVVLVDDALFVTLVNDNMEVRTLVSIKPETGAAENGALFTYEAIPRGALLWFDVIYTYPEVYGLQQITLPKLQEAVESGFALMKFLGAGGMNTRGLGRIEVLSAPCVIEGEVQI